LPPAGLLDILTRIDELLVELIGSTVASNNKLDRLIELASFGVPEEPDIPVNYVPFYSEGSLLADTPVTLLIKSDPEQGLGGVGRSGWVINDGAGSIYVAIDDGRTGKSKEIRIENGEWFSVAREDEIWVDKVTLITAVAGTKYRCLFSR
jgi:hypothetical protein